MKKIVLVQAMHALGHTLRCSGNTVGWTSCMWYDTFKGVDGKPRRKPLSDRPVQEVSHAFEIAQMQRCTCFSRLTPEERFAIRSNAAHRGALTRTLNRLAQKVA